MNLLSHPSYSNYCIYIPPPLLPIAFVITWQHHAGSATNLYSSRTQFVSLPRFRRFRFASWLALVHPGTVLMTRQD